MYAFRNSVLATRYDSSAFSEVTSLAYPSCSTSKIGALLVSRNFFTPFKVRSYITSAPFPGRLGIQSIINSFASISDNKSNSSLSSLPLPENPKLMTGCSDFLFKIFPHAIPGREAQAPCAMEVP